MRKIIEILCVAVAIVSFVFTANEKTLAQFSSECSRQMAAETANYMANSRILLADPVSEFYENKNGQIYLLSSREKVSINLRTPQKRIIAVISQKVENENTVFYLIESEFQQNSIIYSLKRGSETLRRIAVPILIPVLPLPDLYCNRINNQNNVLSAQLQQLANNTCSQVFACFQWCQNGQIIAIAMHVFKPQVLCPGDFDVDTAQSALRKAFDTALEKDSALFTHEKSPGSGPVLLPQE